MRECLLAACGNFALQRAKVRWRGGWRARCLAAQTRALPCREAAALAAEGLGDRAPNPADLPAVTQGRCRARCWRRTTRCAAGACGASRMSRAACTATTWPACPSRRAPPRTSRACAGRMPKSISGLVRVAHAVFDKLRCSNKPAWHAPASAAASLLQKHLHACSAPCILL